MFIALAEDIDPRIVELLRRWGSVAFAENAPRSVVISEDAVLPVQIEILEASEREPEWPGEEGGDQPFLLVNAVLDDLSAARLEDAGTSYLDAGGKSWLPAQRRTTMARQGSSPGRKLYAASIRLGQLLADHPGDPWTERGLAARGHATQATAHRFLGRLEADGLVEREGRGPSTVRWVRDASELRRWLAREGRPRRVASLSCFVDNPASLPRLAGRAFALTGAAAAAEIGLPVLTGESDPVVRVNVAADELEGIPEALGGFRTESGANLTLIADPDRLAFVDPYFADREMLIAPPSRIMLDLYLEARAEAAVEVFLDLWGRREIPGG